jgi:GAF domain-containing protein
MEIVHQKLIMLLAGSALAILMFKLDFDRMVADKFIAIRLKAGAIMISAASLLGILSRIGIIGEWFYTSTFGFLIETISGYTFGWAFIIWGIIDWSKEHFDYYGKPLISSRQRRFSDKLTEELVKAHNIDSLLTAISKYLLLALDCQALSLHQKNPDRRLHLRFQHGLNDESADLIRNPSKENELFKMVLREQQAVTSDEMCSMGLGGDIFSHDGQIACAFTIPIIINDEASALLTIYSTRNRQFTIDDLELLQNAVSSLGQALRQEQAEENYRHVIHHRDSTFRLAKLFDSSDSLTDGFLKASKYIHEQAPFYDICLFVHGDGPVDTLDFALAHGGVICQKTGYLLKSNYPQLYGRRKESPTQSAGIVSYSRLTREFSSHILRMGKKESPLAHLEIRVKGYAKISDELSSLVELLGLNIKQKLDDQMATSIKNQMVELLGAIKYAHESALSFTNLSALLQELANLAINSTPATFCRITLCNSEKTFLRTAAVSQRRPLDWPMQHLTEIPIADVELHKKALLENKIICFSQDNPELAISSGDANLILPSGVRSGMIIPLTIDNQTVGLITQGDFRDSHRRESSELSEILMINLASIISMALTWHRGKRHSSQITEGARKLTMKRREASTVHFEDQHSLNMRSRLNGPLAGILASCEYLRGVHPGLAGEVSRFIDIIERNAAKIHGITSGFTQDINVPDSKP